MRFGDKPERARPHRRAGAWLVCPFAILVFLGLSGCAALTNPVAYDTVPARELPPELRGESREGLDTIPLRYLRQEPPDMYRLAPGDVLGPAQGGELIERANRRGTGTVVTLSAYENDVIHALAKTGGLPGTDAQNEIIVERRSPKGASTPEMIVGEFKAISPECIPGLAFGGP